MTAAERIAALSGGTLCDDCGGAGLDTAWTRDHGLASESTRRLVRVACSTCHGLGLLTAAQVAGLRGSADPREDRYTTTLDDAGAYEARRSRDAGEWGDGS